MGGLQRQSTSATASVSGLPRKIGPTRCGGKKGGKIRAKRMTVEQRKEAARKAVRARWAKVKAKKKPS